MKKIISLVYDVSTERGIVGIYIDHKVAFCEKLPFGNLSSKHLLPTIEKGFHAVGIHASDLTYIAVGVGPGSYTGIRLGAVVAKTLAFACEIPLIGICTLDGFVPTEEGTFAAIVDAKISGVYLQKGIKKGDKIVRTGEPEVIPYENLEEHLSDVKYLVSPNIAPLKIKFEKCRFERLYEWIETTPDLNRFDQMAFDHYRREDFDVNAELKLIYLRKTQAEIEREHN